MEKNIAKQNSFEERMKERIRDSIGELITDEELSRLVNTATNEVFFKPRYEKHGFRTEEKPPFLHEIVKELLRETVRDEVRVFINENKEDVIKQIKDVVSLGMGQALFNSINQMFASSLSNLEGEIRDKIQNQSF